MSCNEDPAKPKARKRKKRRAERNTNSEAKSTPWVFRQERGRPFCYFPDAKYTSSTWELKPEGTSEHTELSHPFMTSQLKPGKGTGFLRTDGLLLTESSVELC